MATAERLQPASMGLFERVKKMLADLFHRKLMEKEAKKAQEKMFELEKRQAREEEDRRKREEDQTREYRERRSGQEQVETLDAARQTRVEEIKRNFDQFIQDHGRTGSGYLYELVRDTDMQDRIKRLIEQSPGVANLIDALTTKGIELHGNPTELIKLCRSLSFEAKKAKMLADISVLTDAMSQQATELVKDTIEVYKKEARARGRQEIDAPIWLIDEFKTVLSDDDQGKLKSGNDSVWSPVIKNLMTNPPEAVDAPWTNVDNGPLGAIPDAPPKGLVQEVDKIWQEVKESEESGQQLSVDKIQEIERKIYATESSAFPKDVIPGTEAYNKTVQASDRFIQERLDRLADQLSKRLKAERPSVRQGITNTKEFLAEMVKHPGRLGELLTYNPEMEKLFVGNVPNTKEDLARSRRFRNLVFLTIHQQILTDRRSSSHENFGLYERADFTTFANLLRSSMTDRIRPSTGTAYGQTWVEWYVSLSNTIRLSRDIDFWASQPGAKIDDFQKSLSLFQNEYSVQALSIPAVEQAFRAYEDTLQSIKDSNDGYIPPALVGYDPIHMDSPWDRMAQQMLEKMMKMGVVHDAARDEGGFHLVEKDGNTIKLGDPLDREILRREDPQDLELNLYMTLAKGFGMSSLRYLEMFANSKVPGSGQPDVGMVNFHSTPYEGVAMSLNYWSVMVHKWKFGSYKYLQVMNTLLPEEHKIRHIDAHEGLKAYLAYRDGTFKEKYGKEAKRLIDLLNFSGCSSAFGPPYTQWRFMDVTIGWSDKQRELLGGPAQIMYSKRFAGAKVKDFLVVGKYREEFRRMMREAGRPTSGTELDRLWQERGEGMYNNKIESEWEMLQKKHGQEIEHLTKQYQRAFTSRVWVEMAMRNPLTVAHNTEIEVPDVIPGKTRKIKLHSYLAQQILGIPLEDLKYGEVAGKAAPYSSPSETQRRLMAEVMDLEGDLAAVREQVIEENRELKESDFDIIKDAKKKEHALQYWQLVRKTMFGDLDHEHLYEQFGLKLAENGEDYEVNWEKIKRIDGVLKHIGAETTGLAETGGRIRLDEEWVDKDWDRTFGSDDVAYRKMNILNLGPRQWVRRGGDAVAHYQGGMRGGQYLIDDLKPNPNPEDLAKALFEVRKAYEGDMIEAGWQVAGLLAHATARLYAYDYRRFGSAAQLDVWKTRRGVAAWNANGRRKFFDALEHLDVLPPVTPSGPGSYTTQGPYKIPHDIHELCKLNRAGNADVWTEIILLGVALAVALTIYRAVTAPSEEEEEGGGGRHH